MSESCNRIELLDAAERERAVSTFDRNIVVTAGAGTGKTTLLVDRLVHLLLRNPDPVRITEIVALTFTNKAANEMKQRLRERLQSYLAVQLEVEHAGKSERTAKKDLAALRKRYLLSKDQADRRIQDALRNIERSDIGTLHSFAASLLRLYPLEAGVDPQFYEDDGKEFDRLFDEQWDLWLDQELSATASQAEAWRTLFAKVTLEHIKALAKSLCSESFAVRGRSRTTATTPQAIREWLTDLERISTALIEQYTEDRMNEKLVRAARVIIQNYLQGAETRTAELEEAKSLVAQKTINRERKGWSENELGKAQELVRAAKGLCQVDAEIATLVWDLLAPFVEKFREFFVREGFVSFDGLLIRARDLVRDQIRVREELKRRYRTILIDEFQDTDPIQYEILLYLAEQEGSSAKDWRKVKLTPGKVFVVGDPKQSIYAFRRADIEAYLEVVEKIIKAQHGVECQLTTNFRSNAGILDVVNGIFAALIQAQDGLQPPYSAIHPAPGRPVAPDSHFPTVRVRKIVSNEKPDAEKARRIEGESLASWLKDEVIGKTIIFNTTGQAVQAQAKDVAILFRKLTDIHDYLEYFRRRDIRYVVEGERHFYAAKEIIDAVNLFRAIENPHDRLALVGVLRSPLGGLTDRQIFELHQADALDYRKVGDLEKHNDLAMLVELYRILMRLHEETRQLPVGEAISKIFASLPLKLLAACYFHGEQAVANLEKLRQQAILLGHVGLTTLKEAIRQLQERVLDVKEEGESVLAEENLDAVRIMSIHKAKGLEFPIVVLAGCHTGTDGRLTSDADALFDWSTGLTGLRIGQIWDLPGLFIAEKSRARAAEEQKRVLYVAMTRAREHLIVSCAPTTRRLGGSFLTMLDEQLNGNIEAADSSKIVSLGNGRIDIEVISQGLTAPGKTAGKSRPSQKRNWQPFLDAWAKRRARYDAALIQPPFLTPTWFKQRDEESTEPPPGVSHRLLERTPALRIGELAHVFLQSWDFTAGTNRFREHLKALAEHSLLEQTEQARGQIEAELEAIFHGFFRSPVYGELAGARILGREVPLLMPWNGQVMEGVIDVIYERSGLLYLADYKTDRIEKKNLSQAATRYRQQAEIYSQAVRQSLGREPAAFKIIFLRLGEAVEIAGEENKQGALF